ncbi:hypothetical protein REPUB_Repub20aG0064800 [Reevesia pubescens]
MILNDFQGDQRVLDDWKSKLYMVFMDNINCRVSKQALWEVFDIYGKVQDIFLPSTNKLRNGKVVAYVFVGYNFHHKMVKAIEVRNNGKINGRVISVKKANIWWKDRKKANHKPSTFKGSKKAHQTCATLGGGRSYKEALMGGQPDVVGTFGPELHSQEDKDECSNVKKTCSG